MAGTQLLSEPAPHSDGTLPPRGTYPIEDTLASHRSDGKLEKIRARLSALRYDSWEPAR